jgi:hypothetical protein
MEVAVGQIGSMIANTGKASMWYAERLLAGIDAEWFALKPRGVDGEIDTNHPAFIFGHLAVYPSWLVGMLGAEAGPAAVSEAFHELFSHKATCVSDPEGTRYPPMDEIVGTFREGYQHLFAVLEGTDDRAFGEPFPSEQMRDMFPTLGMGCSFMVGAHMMSHLGQLSAWRRCFGLGSAM